MAFDFILAGTVSALQNALSALASRPAGLAVIGGGTVEGARILAHVSSWQDLDATSLPNEKLVFAEAPTPCDMRLVFRRLFGSHEIRLLDQGATRALRLEDLVGRPDRKIDWPRIASMLRGKRVLVTGGGGSIGGELSRLIATLSPARLTVLDNSEFNLFRLGVESNEVSPVLADIRDAESMRRWMERERPDFVFHTAALKQVPMAESFPCEAVMTNVCGLRNVAEAARSVGADLVFVSTDKAVDPTGVMGATKRLGELYARALDLRGEGRVVAVRLGNVVGSAGSVVPLFRSQIAARRPVTVTDPGATRYFMSISNAAEALLQSAATALTQPGTRGQVMGVDMGEPLSVMELAESMIMLAGLRPYLDVEIRVTGLRPGERLHESFVGAEEWRAAPPADGVFAVAAPPRALGELHEAIERLTFLARAGHDEQLRAELFAATAPSSKATPAAAITSPVCA